MIFDTSCVLCSRSVHFVLRHERDASTRFVSSASPEGLALGLSFGLTAADLDRTFAVIDGAVCLTRSDAALLVARTLKAPWSVLGTVARLVPRAIRDWVYSAIATRRIKLFGRADTCFVPPTDQRHRFDGGEETQPEPRSL